jgi:hypothetical protein
MTNINSNSKLAIVIHTEEEFNWDGGFYRTNDKVTHGQELIAFCDKMIAADAKITFAMDYAFVNSEQGQLVINHFKSKQEADVEFATHLHPWVNPPYAENDEVSNVNSYPGNLPFDIEFEKLKLLTNKIKTLTGATPITYLAGRYGIGQNTNNILKKLGYKTDISISPFTDYTAQQGPDFNHFNNNIFNEGEIKNWPHTTGVVSKIPTLTSYFNNHPEFYSHSFSKPLSKIFNKIARVKRLRLSPESFSLKDMKQLTMSQIALGQTDFIFSFHSPSVKLGLTPYVATKKDLLQFKKDTLDYIQWFTKTVKGTHVLVKSNNKNTLD